MKKTFIIFCFSLFSFKTNSQDFIEKVVPIKHCKSINDILEDSVLTRFSSILKLDFSKYEILYISDFVNYRDYLIRNKTYFITSSFLINYKNLDTFNIKKNVSSYNQQNGPFNTTKKMMCYKTTLPDDEQNYKVYYSIIW